MSGWNNDDSWAANEGGPSTTWNAGATEAVDWDVGVATTNDGAFNDNGYEAADGVEAMANGEGGGEDRVCRICSEVGHLARECPQKPEGFGKCFNCGEEGPTVPILVSSQEPVVFVLRRAMQHATVRISRLLSVAIAKKKVPDNASRMKAASITTLPVEEAWANVVRTAKEAVETRDLDDFRDVRSPQPLILIIPNDSRLRTCSANRYIQAIRVYQKAVKEITYEEIERSFRVNGIEIYLIATEPKDGEVLDTNTLVNLAGKRDCKYKVGYFFKKTPRTAKMAEVWPSSEEENLERLKDAGVPYERGVPKCLRCKEMGHTGRDCKQERQEFSEVTMKCFNCDEEGHRARDYASAKWLQDNPAIMLPNVPSPVPLKGLSANAARKLATSQKTAPIIPVAAGLAETAGSEEGHMAKECEKPKDPATTTCRNCEQMGHFSRDCPEPKDWSKVKCNTCGEMGHTVKRCPQANADNEAAGVGGYDTGASGEAINGTDGAENANGDAWGAGGGGNDETGGTSGWMTTGAAPDNWGTAPEAATVGGW
ncbi:MAG: hypothetical protein LQ341_002573 [Variospora aurantia]|nr:MAG: hypothetical protein LQ341_002573 [Variospora aurantia]